MSIMVMKTTVMVLVAMTATKSDWISEEASRRGDMAALVLLDRATGMLGAFPAPSSRDSSGDLGAAEAKHEVLQLRCWARLAPQPARETRTPQAAHSHRRATATSAGLRR